MNGRFSYKIYKLLLRNNAAGYLPVRGLVFCNKYTVVRLSLLKYWLPELREVEVSLLVVVCMNFAWLIEINLSACFRISLQNVLLRAMRWVFRI